MNRNSFLVGTSGWTYRHWKGRFYPDSIPQKRWLEYYVGQLSSVELNSSFYRIPSQKTAQGWLDRTPDSFRFSIKMNRLITHERKLIDCEDTINWFFRDLAPLDPKIAAYLIQLPTSLQPSEELLVQFHKGLPPDTRYVLEIRNTAAYCGIVPSVMRSLGFGFCIHDFPRLETPVVVTSDLIYLRFHGYGKRYGGSYPEGLLREWSERIRNWCAEGFKILAYFNNDIDGFAAKNAMTLRRMVFESRSI